ncbi:site-2 protease family protein, partial [Vibrio parahaemolyticus]|nr:site-2 protease family protein [Vibrio parahaemolyticus]
MTGILWNLISFIVALGILVAVHEFGHFWVARRCGVKVEKFSIGFGKSIWSKVGKDGTEYSISMIPLGGYVKMVDSR